MRRRDVLRVAIAGSDSEHIHTGVLACDAAARLDDAEYLARMARLRGDLEIVGVQPARDLPARRAIEWLDALAETWQQTELVEEKSDVIHAIYERIVIEGRFVSVRLTPAAYRHGMALALPEAVMARPTGSGHAVPILSVEGVSELVAAYRAA